MFVYEVTEKCFAVGSCCGEAEEGMCCDIFGRFVWSGSVPWAFSPACRWRCWSSRAQSLRPRSRSTRRGATACSTQSHRLPSYRSWNSSRSARRETHAGSTHSTTTQTKTQTTIQLGVYKKAHAHSPGPACSWWPPCWSGCTPQSAPGFWAAGWRCSPWCRCRLTFPGVWRCCCTRWSSRSTPGDTRFTALRH